MILVDTTVWIDFFSNRKLPHVISLIDSIEQRDELCLCGIILTEILQGIKNEGEYKIIEQSLHPLIFLDMKQSTFKLAADIFRTLQKRGITIRKTVDCMIAAVAIENEAILLHNDRDFDPIKKYCGLHTLCRNI